MTYKENSEAWLRERGIPINNWFAASEEDPWPLRPATQVAERAMVLTLVAASALSEGHFSGEQVRDWLQERGILGSISPNEKCFLSEKRHSERDTINYGWQIEAAWTLAWALSWTNDMGSMNEPAREPWFYDNVFTTNTATLLQKAELRSEPEIHATLDLVIRIHWAIRHCELEKMPLPKDIDPGIVVERHRALNWLTDLETEWDDVTTDT